MQSWNQKNENINYIADLHFCNLKDELFHSHFLFSRFIPPFIKNSYKIKFIRITYISVYYMASLTHHIDKNKNKNI